MEKKYSELSLSYKGERAYIQGPDLYNAVSQKLGVFFEGEAWVKRIVFRGFSSSGCRVYFGEGYDSNLVRANVFVSIGDQTHQGVIIETGQDVLDRNKYDESRVCKNTVINGKSATQTAESGLTAIENIVAITKLLHNTLYPIDGEGKWIFAQLDLVQPLQGKDSLYTVDIKQSIGGRMTVSEIRVGNVYFGKIRFAVAAI